MSEDNRDTVDGLLDAGAGNSIYGHASFSLGHRLFRVLWNVVWLGLAAWTPAPLHCWRRTLLRAFGAHIGRGARIYGSARIWYPPNLYMDEYSVLGWNVNCYCQGKIRLEPFANVAQYSHLVSGTHDIDMRNFQLLVKPITIGRHAWVASDAFVGPGVTIGEGAVLGARGVTFKDLEPWTVYVGNPAMKVRTRRSFIDAQGQR